MCLNLDFTLINDKFVVPHHKHPEGYLFWRFCRIWLMFGILNGIQNIKHINRVWLDIMVKSCDVLRDVGVLH